MFAVTVGFPSFTRRRHALVGDFVNSMPTVIDRFPRFDPRDLALSPANELWIARCRLLRDGLAIPVGSDPREARLIWDRGRGTTSGVDGIEIRTLRDGEHERLLDLLETAFHERQQFARYLHADSLVGPDDSWIALDDARVVGSVQIFDKSIRLNGQVVSIGGIGSVAAHPEYERRGIATQLLRHAIRDMETRGHSLSLLFTTRISFYERLDWVQIMRPVWTLTRNAPLRPAVSRRFATADLERIERIYDYYNLRANTSAVRDRNYWRAQLGYAGTPEEDFRVVERDGKIVAYARGVDFFGIPRIIEHGCAPDGRHELARLLGEFTPDSGALLVHRTDDTALAAALQRTDVSVQSSQWGDNMWRVIDRPRLLALAQLPDSVSDAELLTCLVGGDSAVYWASDRF